MAIVLVILIIAGTISFFVSGAHDKKTITDATNLIQLPSSVKVKTAEYSNNHNFDTPAENRIFLVSNDGNPIDEAEIIEAIESAGYQMTMKNYYTRSVNGSKVAVSLASHTTTPNELMIVIQLTL